MNYIKLLLVGAVVVSCTDLDLQPKSQSSVPTFYSNEKELELAVNSLYTITNFSNDDEAFSDNLWDRVATGNVITFGTMTSDNSTVLSYWSSAYSCIAKANAFLENKDKAKDNTPATKMLNLEAEARAIRALQYARLITHFGDVPLITETGSLADSYKLVRTSQEEVLDFIFSELDWAALNLPDSYSGVKRLTKGAALAIKARTALYMSKWDVAAAASKAVMDLAATGVYSLHANYSELFLKEGGTSKEIIISLPRSEQLGVRVTGNQPFIPNLSGGYGSKNPTWDLMVSYECVDGLPVDESPMYNPQRPFDNRDPRLAMTIVEFGIPWLGFIYQPHPDSLLVKDAGGVLVSNRNSRGVNVNSSWNGLVWKKGIDETWLDVIHDMDYIALRYAEMLLTYAEAKVELNQIDASVLDAINQVRARAYGVAVADVASYPAVATTDAAELKTIIKRERRVEFALEGTRYMDLIRWRIAEKALTRPVYGMPDPANQDRSKWLFAGAPAIDEDGVPDWTPLLGTIKRIADRNFNKDRQYVWPIPSRERLLNDKLTQNPEY